MDRYFSILAFPFGLILCFGPALYVWLKMELKSPKEESKDPRSRKH